MSKENRDNILSVEYVVGYLKRHKHSLNLAELSRNSGVSSQYLKHVVAGRLSLSEQVKEKLLKHISFIVSDLHEINGRAK